MFRKRQKLIYVPQVIGLLCSILLIRQTHSFQFDLHLGHDVRSPTIDNHEHRTLRDTGESSRAQASLFAASESREDAQFLASESVAQPSLVNANQDQAVNISQVLFRNFYYLFTDQNQNSTNEYQQQQQHQQQQSHEQDQQVKRHLEKLTELFVLNNVNLSHVITSNALPSQQRQQQQQSSLETRTTVDNHYGAPQAYEQLYDSSKNKNFIRILNRVFSRVELPDSFRRSSSSAGLVGGTGSPSTRGAGSSANLSSGSSGSTSSASTATNGNAAGGHCGNHIGCIAELPNFPMILKLKPNVSASFTVYTRERGHKNGQRILFEPLLHHQLQDGDKLSDFELQQEVVNITRQLKLDKLLPMMPYYKHSSRRHHHNHLGRQELRQRLQTTAASWLSGGNRIATTKELPFDLAALEQSGFNSSLTTRIIIGGYFAKEDEEWIDEIIKQWLLLEPSNVIKVSWQDSNRGLYHSAAYNSRIVGRQLSLFLHYLNELFHIDLNKFHLVGHSLGAHIAGFVGADNDGQIARITGLDPAGPIFVELNQGHRLDASDAKFVDVVHTNGGTITKGALGLSTPSGHVDYYCNGGSLQPGCFFSSVTMSIMDPVERIACNHRRSYRYFTEIIKLAIKQRARDAESTVDSAESNQEQQQLSVDESSFPQALLFEAKQEDLVKLVQPDVKLVRQKASAEDPPTRKLIEFHSLNPDYPRDKRGLYYFRTRTETPFFGSKQFALRFGVDQPIKRKITLSIKINTTLVGELELDELDDSHSLVFVLQNANLIDHATLFSGKASRAPDLWLMWRQRSFNLLLAQSNELHLNSIELDLLDGNEHTSNGGGGSSESSTAPSGSVSDRLNMTTSTAPPDDHEERAKTNRSMRQRQPTSATVTNFVVRYEPNVVNSKNNENFLSRIQHSGAGNNNIGNGFSIARNQWHKFDGRPFPIRD